jgi:hypothetical protein
VSGTSRCLFSDKYKTHQYNVGGTYNCWMLNCWCITWPVGFKRLIYHVIGRHAETICLPIFWTTYTCLSIFTALLTKPLAKDIEYSWMSRCVHCWTVTDFSKGHSAPIFRVKPSRRLKPSTTQFWERQISPNRLLKQWSIYYSPGSTFIPCVVHKGDKKRDR